MGTLLMLFITFTGCSASRNERLVDLGFSTPYLEGYDDGCHSKVTNAKTTLEGFKKDPERMMRQARYADGWNDGYEQCFIANKTFY